MRACGRVCVCLWARVFCASGDRHRNSYSRLVRALTVRPNWDDTMEERYLEMRPNLKTKDDFRKIFVPNSMLTEPIIEGLIKAGWQPES